MKESKLTKRILDRLFQVGPGETAASRLQLKFKSTSGGEIDGGGWCRAAVASIFAEELKIEAAIKRKKKR